MKEFVATLAACILGAGVIAWVWTGEWRLFVTGLVMAGVCAVIGGQLK